MTARNPSGMMARNPTGHALSYHINQSRVELSSPINGWSEVWEVVDGQRKSLSDREVFDDLVQRIRALCLPLPPAPRYVELRAMLGGTGTITATLTRKARRRQERVGEFLRKIAWFCRGETREMLLVAAADLRRDVRAMRAQSYGTAHIRAVCFWQTTMTIVPIVWDGLKRVVGAVLVLPGLLKKFRGPAS